MKILFLTVSVGGGHNTVAINLKKYIESHYPSISCKIVDALKEINPIVDKVIVGSYLGTLKASPKLYGKLYSFADSTNSVNDFSRQVNKILSIKLNRLIRCINPDIIVCTHPFPIEMINILKKKNKLQLPTIAILTDYAPHTFWIYKNIDSYIIPHDGLKDGMIKKGIPEDKVACLGLPTDRIFTRKHDRKRCLEILGLQDKKTILIMGGSLGFGDIEYAFEKLIATLYQYQIIVICGRNEKLYLRLKKFNSLNSNIKIVGFTDKIALYMAISDILLTKPGGMTIAEALNIGVPIGLMAPIPGHEERNARFLLNQGAAIELTQQDSFVGIIKNFLEDPVKFTAIKASAKKLSKPHALQDISEYIIEKAIGCTEKERVK